MAEDGELLLHHLMSEGEESDARGEGESVEWLSEEDEEDAEDLATSGVRRDAREMSRS